MTQTPQPAAFRHLLERTHTLHDLMMATGVLHWDREVNMPEAGHAVRVRQITTLRRLAHELLTSDETGEAIAAAKDAIDGAPYESFEAGLVREAERAYDDARKLPTDYVERASQVSGEAHRVWVRARAEDDFAAFAPWLERVVDLCREKAELYGYEDEPYDALLDKFERDARTAEVHALLGAAREELVPLLQAIGRSPVEVDDAPLHAPFPIEGQQRFARTIAAAVGYDLERGHLGTAVHPFAISFGRDDVRITTRWYPDFLGPSLFGTLHESGHAMYEQGTDPAYARTPLARGASMGLHESQSRMFENLVGRSRGFWQRHYGHLQETFPDRLGNTSLDDFYRAINKVQPSLIRVEADELTYNLHIILRFELELALLHGDLQARDVPAAWGERMEQLLGIRPPTDRQGCLQDVHWTRPDFGYFPTYALGNLYAAQILEAAKSADGAIGEGLARGETDALLAWLRANVHRFGKLYTPAELVQRCTGKPLSHEPFVRYARAKFGPLYGV